MLPAPERFEDLSGLGSYGEQVAARFLSRNHGYRLLLKNYETDMLVFVEVRTRYDESYGLPVESIKETKRQHLRLAGERYLRELKTGQEIFTRFDAVSVLLKPGLVPKCLLHTDLFQIRT